jgi:hypothetical protein
LEEETQARRTRIKQEFEDRNNRLVRERATYAQEQEDRKTRLEREKLLYEAQLRTATTAPTVPSITAHEELQEGETPLEALAISEKFPGLPHSQIALIFLNKFEPKNLHKLRRGGDINDDLEEDVTLSGGRLRVKRTTGTAKDYPTSALWSECFINYVSIFIAFKGPNHPALNTALLEFHNDIVELSRTYPWTSAVLPLALQFHSERAAIGITDAIA